MPPNRNHVYKVKQGKYVGKNQSKYAHNWPQHDDCFIQRCVVMFTSQELSKKDTNDCKKRVRIEDDTHDDNIEGMCGYIFKANMLQFFLFFTIIDNFVGVISHIFASPKSTQHQRKNDYICLEVQTHHETHSACPHAENSQKYSPKKDKSASHGA